MSEEPMRAAVLDRYGKAAPVVIRDVPRPQPTLADHVLVRVHAAGVNPLDCKTIDGKLKLLLPYKTPFVLGNEMSGTVERVGAEVTDFREGDEVFARLDKKHIGAFAEHVVLRARELAKKPATISHEEAASLPLASLTAWQALVDIAKVEKGQRVFVPAGSGGVGTIAIQLAKHLGAEVATTASAASFPLVKRLGADVSIDYRAQKIDDELKDYDMVLESLGGDDLARAFAILKRGGTLVTIGDLPTPSAARALGMNVMVCAALWFLNIPTRWRASGKDIHYEWLFMRPDGKELGEIAKLVDAGKIKPVIDQIFPFEDSTEALARVRSGRAKGKVVIRIR